MIGSTVAVAAAGVLAFGGLFGVEGNGKIKEDPRKVAAFTGVEVGGSVKADVRVGPEQKVVVVTDENLLPLVRTHVENGVLEVKFEKSLRPSKDVRLIVVTPKLDKVSASGGSELTAQVAASPRFSIEGSGGADIDVKGLDTAALLVELSGGVDADLAGRAKAASFELSGGVDLSGYGLAIEEANLEASGGVDVELNVSKRLVGEASGGVHVALKGNPELKLETSGAARVKRE